MDHTVLHSAGQPNAPASRTLPGRDHRRCSPMAVLDSTTASAASRRDARTWEKIGVGLKRQAGTDIYKSTVWEAGEERKIHFRARTLSDARQRHEKRRVSVREGLEPVRTKVTLDELAQDR